jgi:hypothetical protein
MKTSFTSTPLRAITSGLILYLLMLCTVTGLHAQSSQGPRNGSTFTTVAIAGSSATWSNPSNAQTVNSVYSVNSANLPLTGNYTDYIVATNFGFTIPAGNQIDGIQVRITRLEDNANARDFRVRLVKGGVIGTTDLISGTNWPSTNTTRVHGTSTDLWGNTWTLSDINASNFGVAVAVQRSSNSATPIGARIDNIRVTVYYSTPPPALPVELVAFNAAMNTNGTVSLNWETATETNNDFFTLERGTDPATFETIATINGNGNSAISLDYSYTDVIETPSATVPFYFYQLSQTDFDGTTKIIGQQAVKTQKEAGNVSVYPNPFESELNIYMESTVSSSHVMLTDVFGKTIYSEDFPSNCESEFTIKLPEKVNPGIYYLTVDNGKEKIVKRIMRSKE